MAREKSRRGGKSEVARSRRELREKTREVYREAILVAAERVFARHGFAGSRMADIAEAAGVATGTLYNYFRSKDEVFTSLVALLGQAFVDRGRAALEPFTDPVERLEALVRFTFEYIEEHEATWTMFTEFGAVPESDLGRIAGQVAGGEVTRRSREWNQAIVQVLAEAKDSGVTRADLAPEQQAAFLSGITNVFCQAWVTGASPSGQLVAKTPLVLDLFLRGAGSHS